MAFPRWDRKDWGPYFREIADRLRLRDWVIYMVEEAPAESNVGADTRCTKGRKHACIRLSEEFLRDPEPDQRQATVHELIHCHTAFLDHTIQQCVNERDEAVCILALEYAIDGLADAIAPLMPLPSEILGKSKKPAKPARKRRPKR